MSFIILGTLAGLTILYGVKSALTAKRDLKKNKAYREAVIENVIKKGRKLKSKYTIQDSMEGDGNFKYMSLINEDI